MATQGYYLLDLFLLLYYFSVLRCMARMSRGYPLIGIHRRRIGRLSRYSCSVSYCFFIFLISFHTVRGGYQPTTSTLMMQ